MILKTFSKGLARMLHDGDIAVIPTDTLYGIVGSALMPDVVEHINAIRGRSRRKPMIVLISSPDDIAVFGIRLSKKQREFLDDLWPGRVSVALRCSSNRFWYLHRSTRSLAFRVPASAVLCRFIEKTGPLVAPSANPEGRKPAYRVGDAKNYFENAVDMYVDGGTLKKMPSTVIKLGRRGIQRIRDGAVPFSVIERRWLRMNGQ
jgi:L-threonylcarbamoyladenylate synthase